MEAIFDFFKGLPELVTGSNVFIVVVGATILFLLKQANNEKVKIVVKYPFYLLAVGISKTFYGIGIVITKAMSSNKVTAAIWNSGVEPYLIDLIDNVVNGILDGVEEVFNALRNGLFEGLRSDNKKE